MSAAAAVLALQVAARSPSILSRSCLLSLVVAMVAAVAVVAVALTPTPGSFFTRIWLSRRMSSFNDVRVSMLGSFSARREDHVLS